MGKNLGRVAGQRVIARDTQSTIANNWGNNWGNNGGNNGVASNGSRRRDKVNQVKLRQKRPGNTSGRITSKKITSERSSSRETQHTSTADTLQAYFNNIRSFELLTRNEEKELSIRIAGGDAEARRRMIVSNLRLVISIARRYSGRGLPLQDLIEEGNVGLIYAVERFKGTKGCKFSTYATYWIKQSVERALVNQSESVRIPIHVTHDISRLRRCGDELRKRLQRDATTTELAEMMGVTGRYVKKLGTISKKCCSLDAALSANTTDTLLDRLPENKIPEPIEVVGNGDRTVYLKRLIGSLEDQERRIVRLRFGLDGEPQTLETIGNIFGVTRERVRQIESRALRRLREMMGKEQITSMEMI